MKRLVLLVFVGLAMAGGSVAQDIFGNRPGNKQPYTFHIGVTGIFGAASVFETSR